MLTIINNAQGFHLVNVTLGAVIATFKTIEEAQQLKNKILN